VFRRNAFSKLIQPRNSLSGYKRIQISGCRAVLKSPGQINDLAQFRLFIRDHYYERDTGRSSERSALRTSSVSREPGFEGDRGAEKAREGIKEGEKTAGKAQKGGYPPCEVGNRH
jgi:hypothetical protein